MIGIKYELRDLFMTLWRAGLETTKDWWRVECFQVKYLRGCSWMIDIQWSKVCEAATMWAVIGWVVLAEAVTIDL